MTHPPQIYLPFFGEDPRFEKLLEVFMARFKEVCPTAPEPIVIVSRQQAQLYPFKYEVVDLVPWMRYIRVHTRAGTFDRKGALVGAHCQVPKDHPRLYLDLDQYIRRDPYPYLMTLDGEAMGMPEEGYVFQITRPSYSPIISLTAGMMLIPADARLHAQRYQEFWHELKWIHTDHTLMEQWSWSLVWYSFANSVRFPRYVSWSKEWGAEPADCLLRHFHGAEKWEVPEFC